MQKNLGKKLVHYISVNKTVGNDKINVAFKLVR